MTSSSRINAQAPYNPTSTANDLGQGTLGKEDFLKLLVAQLAHQDPSAPTDPSAFVAQLAQFSSLEQLANIKSGMDLLAITQTAGTSAQMVSFIGKEVSFDSGQVNWAADSKPISMDLSLDAPAASIQEKIVDANGTVIDTRELGAMSAGSHTVTFDGTKADGSKLAPGSYHVELATKDAHGDAHDIPLRARGTVTAVTFEAGYPQLVLADGRVLGLGQVLQVLGAITPAPAPSGPAGDAPADAPVPVDPTHTDDATPLP